MRLASIYKFIALEMLLQALYYLYPQLQIVSAVSEDQLTNLLAFIGAFPDELTVALEKMLGEEFGEFSAWSVRIVVYSFSEVFAENESVCKRTVHRTQPFQN